MSSDEGLRIEERGASDEFEGKQRNKENMIALLRQSWGYKPDLNVSLCWRQVDGTRSFLVRGE
jgi:hypothetical protein